MRAMSNKMKLFIPCYYAFLANGMMALVVGTVLPYLIEEAGISYSVAGGFLSAFAIGNLLASFVNPIIVTKLGQKRTISLLSMLVPLNLFVITLLPPIGVMYIAFILLGIGRGSVSITNNMIVNDYDGSPLALNLLHTIFAVGAFLAPFLTSVYISQGFNWRAVVYTIILLSMTSCMGYWTMPLVAQKKEKTVKEKSQGETFMRNADFYLIGGVLFFYLGVENCVNGWFVTYFKSIGVMSDAYATNLVSITWVVIMLGRLCTGYLSKRISGQKLILINCICTAIFFVLLIATTNLLVITIAVVGLGFFFAGIYPTGVANGGKLIKGSTTGMSVLLAMAALGGIITPQIVGVLGDVIGMTGAIVFLIVNITMMIVLAFISDRRARKLEKVVSM